MKAIPFCIVFILLNFYSFAQKKVNPDVKEIEIAKEFKAKFPDDDVALQQSQDHVTFGFDKKTNKVTVEHKSMELLINMDVRSDIQRFRFYDNESAIDEFKVLYKNNSSTDFYIKDEAYSSEDLFHVDSRVKYVNLDFPVQGYQYYIKQRKRYNDIKYFNTLYFNDILPTIHKEVKIEVPNWLNIELREINFNGFAIKKEITDNKEANTKTYKYTLEDIDAIYKEANAPGPTYIYPHILILAKSYEKEGKNEPVFDSTQDLYNWYKKLIASLQNDNTSFKGKVEELTKDAKTDNEKIKNIYYWVQDNIRYIAFEDGIAGFKPDEATNVFTKRYGDCKGMANLMKQMLVEAGFDARLTWIGTKRIAYDYSTPCLAVDNHMICTLFNDGKPIFLDATEKFNAFGEYAERIQGKQALIENGDEFILTMVPSVDGSFNKEKIEYNFTLEGESLVGSATKEYHGEKRTSLLNYLHNLESDKKEDFLEWFLSYGNSNIKAYDIETSDLQNRELTLNLSYNISLKNSVSSFDNDIYIDIDFDKQFVDFDLKKRKTDYVFDYKQDLESVTNLKIPTNYTISQIPESLEFSNENFEVQIDFQQKEDIIAYKKRFYIKKSQVNTSGFEDWDKLLSNIKNIYNQQIILTKN